MQVSTHWARLHAVILSGLQLGRCWRCWQRWCWDDKLNRRESVWSQAEWCSSAHTGPLLTSSQWSHSSHHAALWQKTSKPGHFIIIIASAIHRRHVSLYISCGRYILKATFQVKESSRLPFLSAMSVSLRLTMTGCVVSSERGHLFILLVLVIIWWSKNTLFLQHFVDNCTISMNIYLIASNTSDINCFFLMLYSV